jgi:hypothetical protein
MHVVIVVYRGPICLSFQRTFSTKKHYFFHNKLGNSTFLLVFLKAYRQHAAEQIKTLFIRLIFRLFGLFFHPKQYFSLTTNQPTMFLAGLSAQPNGARVWSYSHGEAARQTYVHRGQPPNHALTALSPVGYNNPLVRPTVQEDS